MNSVTFSVEEENVISIYHGRTRELTIVSLIRVLEHVKDEKMRKVIISCIEKLADISDQDFDSHNFTMTK
ncbi:MAG: hypothetical protein IKN47_00070 [Lachnospiraceae bacterium]|jgi:hypothetical protein|nr:hypothetical protein [Lachnospiraceae bacterium]